VLGHHQWLTTGKVYLFYIVKMWDQLFPHVGFGTTSIVQHLIAIFPIASGQSGLILVPTTAKDMSATAATEIAQIAEAYVPIAHPKLIIRDTFDMMPVMFVGTPSAREEAGFFLLVATTTGRIGSFIQHVLSKVTHGCVAIDLFQ
jgi:hypothetical protein